MWTRRYLNWIVFDDRISKMGYRKTYLVILLDLTVFSLSSG